MTQPGIDSDPQISEFDDTPVPQDYSGHVPEDPEEGVENSTLPLVRDRAMTMVLNSRLEFESVSHLLDATDEVMEYLLNGTRRETGN